MVKKDSAPVEYVALVGLDYRDKEGKPKRVEPGQVATDIPAHSLPWLLQQGLIEKKEG